MRIREAVADARGRLRRADFDAFTRLLHWTTLCVPLLRLAATLSLDRSRASAPQRRLVHRAA